MVHEITVWCLWKLIAQQSVVQAESLGSLEWPRASERKSIAMSAQGAHEIET